MYDMLRKYMAGGKVYVHGGEHNNPETEALLAALKRSNTRLGNPPSNPPSAEEAARQLSASRGSEVTTSGAENARRLESEGWTAGRESTASSIAARPPSGLGESPSPPEETRRGEDLSPIRPRGLRPIKNDQERPGIKGNTQATPKKAPSTDYSLRPIVRGGGSGMYTEASNKGVMGIAGRGKDGKERYFYLPEITSQPGFSKGSYQKQTQGALKDIRSEFGEDAFMEALGMLEKRGVDISPYVD
jgi:hypothetical protein